MISRSAIAPSRLDSASEMPGLYCRLTRIVPSLKGGRNVARQQVGADARCQHAQQHGGEQGPGAPESPMQEPGVARLQLADQEAVAVCLCLDGPDRK